MFISLQGRQAVFEQTNQQLRDALPESLFRFLTAGPGSDWDASRVVSGESPTWCRARRCPSAEVADLAPSRPPPRRLRSAGSATLAAVRDWRRSSPCRRRDDEAAIIGSNNWAVDAAHSAGGRALVANDMHLSLGVPNIWYRASMAFPDPGDPLKTLRITGVTLPGLPVAVVGSNGYVAWGFTNTGGDWSDLVPDRAGPARSGALPHAGLGRSSSTSARSSLPIKGDGAAAASTCAARSGDRSCGRMSAGREYAQRWVAHDPALLASDFGRPERTRTVDELMTAIAGLGLPEPERDDGRRERARGLDDRRRDSTTARPGRVHAGIVGRRIARVGRLSRAGRVPADRPTRVGGRIWTANAPVVDGARLALIGDGGYADGIRARIIRDRLMAIENATPRQMLDIQLDDTALFLDRWRTLAVDALAHASAAAPADRQASRAEFRRLVDATWTGHASPESVAYRLVRTFRHARGPTRAHLRHSPGAWPAIRASTTRGRCAPKGRCGRWSSTRPTHLLDPAFSSWDDLLIAVVDAAIAELTEGGRTLDGRTWGEVNRALIQHPLAGAVPQLHRWLNMPEDPLPGDVYTPRAQSPARRTVGAHGGLAGPRGGRHPAHADRPERASLVAVLRVDAPRMGGRHCGPVPPG